ncbi:MAG: diguanylate cyclase [Verrucomicrobia bacterium]|nr:diguanylate cyclase [Verrucomicrobiota bacterium]MBT7067025.1 diguanylate cyclase [Verrucomicrobiota bacterium]MBT7702365.1 diguanylate cyclase [Verrucomicrobiota bacterium]
MDGRSTATESSKYRVLVVDDDPAIRQTYRDVLEDQSYPVAVADGGHSALQILMQQTFDVVIVDLKMEEMDGIVFIQEALKIWPGLGIIISAYISRDVPVQAAALGVTHILEKPVDIVTFTETIDAEGDARQAADTTIPESGAIELMREHHKLLAGISHRSLSSETLAGALREFGNSLGNMVAADLVGILVKEHDQDPTMILTPQRAVAPTFIEGVKGEMTARFQVLSGNALDRANLQVHLGGASVQDGTRHAVGNSLSVPILIEREVRGLLTLATASDAPYTPSQTSLLYHTANHISAVFTALRKMHGLATRDPLTGIFNRTRLEEELDRAWLTSRRYDSSMGVVVVDVDNFKTINDAYGHSIGDEILRDFAQVMTGAARNTDIIARYGGDEFVAILPRAGETNARTFAERLLYNTRRHTFCHSSHRLNITISIGVSTTDNPTSPATSSVLVGQADRALYSAKRAGRNRICVWPEKAYAPDDSPVAAPGKTSVTADPSPARASGARIIVVEDEDGIRRLVTLMLERDKHDVIAFPNATLALDELTANPGSRDILLTDIGLPDKSGIELLHEVAALDDSIIKIVMTGHATVDNAIQCLREGAYDFIQKPIERSQLLALLRRAMEYRDLKIENDRYQAHLEAMVRERSAKLAASLQDIQASYEFTLEALVRMLDAREEHTGRHSKHVRELAVALAQEMGVNAEQQETVASGAFLHDIGKIAIPDNILLKPGPLTDEEWAIMKTHSQTGYDILRSSQFLQHTAQVVYQHHEHFDGSGYPQGLSGKDISEGARIFAVIDAYDAMRSERVYRDAIPHAAAVEEIMAHAGTQFDPDVVEAFKRCQAELEHITKASEAA